MITDKVGGSSAKPEVSKQSKEKRLKHKVSGYKSQSKWRSIAGCRLLLRTLAKLSLSLSFAESRIIISRNEYRLRAMLNNNNNNNKQENNVTTTKHPSWWLSLQFKLPRSFTTCHGGQNSFSLEHWNVVFLSAVNNFPPKISSSKRPLKYIFRIMLGYTKVISLRLVLP